MKCPSCNFAHHAKTDVFGNQKGADCDYDAREIFGIAVTCPICLEECTEIVALPCGHVLCKADYRRMGGSVRRGGARDRESEEGSANDDGVLVHVQNAGRGGVNGTYRRHRGDPAGRYTSMGRYNGGDVEYCIELRVADDGAGMWYLSCRTGNPSEPPVDFYRAKVNECEYPYRVRWEAATLLGTFPAPRVVVSHFT
jgi:hypothetical protein